MFPNPVTWLSFLQPGWTPHAFSFQDPTQQRSPVDILDAHDRKQGAKNVIASKAVAFKATHTPLANSSHKAKVKASQVGM